MATETFELPELIDVLELVEDFHAAVNGADARSLEKLAADDIVLAGPSNEGTGRALLKPWLVQSGLSFRPLRWFYGGDRTVVVEQLVHRPERGPRNRKVWTEERLASAFIVNDGRITRCERFTDLPSALSATGLTLRHEVEPPPPPL